MYICVYISNIYTFRSTDEYAILLVSYIYIYIYIYIFIVEFPPDTFSDKLSAINCVTYIYVLYIGIYIGKVLNFDSLFILYIIYSVYKDFAKQRYNTPYACNVI